MHLKKMYLGFCALVVLLLVMWSSQSYYVRLSGSRYAWARGTGTGTINASALRAPEGGLDWNRTNHKLMQSNGSATISPPLDLHNSPGGTETLSLSIPNQATPGVQRGYVLIIRFPSDSQQAVGLRAVMSVQCWIGSFGLPMYIVEPFIENSIAHTRPQPVRNTTLLSLSDFYNLEHYNAQSKQQGMAEAVTWEDFVDNAPRQVIFIVRRHQPHRCICLSSTNDSRVRPPEIVWKSTKTERCKSSLKDNRYLNALAQLGFCVVMIVEIYPDPYICSEEEMYKLIFGGWKPSNVTLIFNVWCPIMYIPNLSLSDPKLCQRACSEGLVNKYLPSAQLLDHIQMYESKSSLDHGKLGVRLAIMLRTEHVVYPLHTDQQEVGIKLCLAQTSRLVRTLQGRLGVNQPFITVDLGKYGSNTWKTTLIPAPQLYRYIMNDIISEFLNHSLTFEEWEENIAKAMVSQGITDRGYVAALQQGMASRADCIVLLGGGNFLHLALHEYLNLHPDVSSWCIYFVCIEKKFMDEYTASIGRHSRYKVVPYWKLLPENETLNLYIGAFNLSDFI